MLISLATLHFSLIRETPLILYLLLLTPLQLFCLLPTTRLTNRDLLLPKLCLFLTSHQIQPLGVPLSAPWTRGKWSEGHESYKEVEFIPSVLCTGYGKKPLFKRRKMCLSVPRAQRIVLFLPSLQKDQPADGVWCWLWGFLCHVTVIQEAEDPLWGEPLT